MVAEGRSPLEMAPLTPGYPLGEPVDVGKLIPDPDSDVTGGAATADAAAAAAGARAPAGEAGPLTHLDTDHHWSARSPKPRADVVPSRERPEGHYATPTGRTPLMQHLDYFDLNKDGRITFYESWQALRYMRFAIEPLNTLISFWVALAFHLPLFYWTQDSWLPSPLLTIHTRNVHRLMRFSYGSSSKTLDAQGRFVPQAFEDLWLRYAQGKARMTPRDVAALVWNSASWANPFGAILSAFQWALTLWLFHDDSWNLRKNDIRGLYDGTAFYRLADRNGFPWYGLAARRDAVAHHNLG